MGRIRQLIREGRVQLARMRDPESFNRHAMVGPGQHWRFMRQYQIDFLRSHGLQPEHALVDLGCGTLRGGVPVIEYLEPGNYYGLDARDDVLAEGRKELARYNLEHKDPTLLNSSDFSALRCDATFDMAWSYAVLIHLADPIIEQAFAWIGDRMRADGVFFADVQLGEHRDAPRNEESERDHRRRFPVVWRPMEFYRDVAAKAGFTNVEDLGTNRGFGHNTGMKGDDRNMLRFTRGYVVPAEIAPQELEEPLIVRPVEVLEVRARVRVDLVGVVADVPVCVIRQPDRVESDEGESLVGRSARI